LGKKNEVMRISKFPLLFEFYSDFALAWGVVSEYGTLSTLASWPVDGSGMRESLDEPKTEDDEEAGFQGERELNQIIDQLILILEKVRIRRLTIDVDYESAALQKDVVLSLSFPSLEYSDVTRHCSDLPPSPGISNRGPDQQTTVPSSPSWNPSVLVKSLRFPSLEMKFKEKMDLDLSKPKKEVPRERRPGSNKEVLVQELTYFLPLYRKGIRILNRTDIRAVGHTKFRRRREREGGRRRSEPIRANPIEASSPSEELCCARIGGGLSVEEPQGRHIASGSSAVDRFTLYTL